MHLFDAARRFYGGNAIVGGGLPLAAGLALADQMQGGTASPRASSARARSPKASSTRRMNLAALWRLPVLFCCENNLYAMGTALERSESETDLALKAACYGMPAWAVDGMDVVAVEEAARRAVAEIRARWRAGVPRAAHVPLPGPLDVRPRALPDEGGGRRAGASAIRSTTFADASARRRLADRRRPRPRSSATVAAEIDAAVAIRRGRHPGTGRGPHPVRVHARSAQP